MKRRPIIILLFLTHALLKIVTFQDAMKKANFIRSFGAAGMFHEYLKVQLEQGSCDEATEALLSYERMLEQFKDRDGALILGGLSSFDRVSTHVRLVKIVRKPESKVVINLDRYGNTTAGTIPLGLRDAVEQGRLHKGDLVLIVTVGAGYTTGAVLLRWAY